uniref:Transposase n=1 Tax=Hymenolepis diminuta TaxID=6216 RepID=A0A0R3SJJ5_HYMDI
MKRRPLESLTLISRLPCMASKDDLSNSSRAIAMRYRKMRQMKRAVGMLPNWVKSVICSTNEDRRKIFRKVVRRFGSKRGPLCGLV